MRKYKLMIVMAGVAIVALITAPTLYADDSHEPSGSVKPGGMMGQGNTTGRTSGMMGGRGAMMQGGHSSRPNEQWRKDAPTTPDKDN